MSKVVNESETSFVPNELLVEFLPEEITINPKFDVRGGEVSAGDEASDQELRDSIKLHGQRQPVLLRRVEGGVELVFGNRRYNAIQQINIEAEDGVAPLKVKAILTDLTDEQALQAAWDENSKRRNPSAIGEAVFIKSLRESRGWKGAKGTRKLSEFLGKSPAWVTEREKLLTLDADIQARVMNGQLSADAALMLPNVKPEMREQVIADAKAGHEAEVAAGKGRKKKPVDADVEAIESESGLIAPVVQTPIPARHIEKAIRNAPEVKVDPNKTHALKAKSIVEFFDSYRDGVPFLYSAVQEFILYFVDKYAKGKGTDKTMEAKFEAMIAPACKGPKCEPSVVDEPPMPKAVKAKAKKPADKPAKKPAAKKPAVKPAKKKSK